MFCNGFAFIRAAFLGTNRLDVDPAVKGGRFTLRPREVSRRSHSPALRVGRTLLLTDQAGGKRQRSTILT